MSVVGATDACLAVNGDAIDASPSLTIGAERPSPSSFSSSISFFSFCFCISWADRWRLRAELVLDSGFPAALPLDFDGPSPFTPIRDLLGSVVDLGFFDLEGFVSFFDDDGSDEDFLAP